MNMSMLHFVFRCEPPRCERNERFHLRPKGLQSSTAGTGQAACCMGDEYAAHEPRQSRFAAAQERLAAAGAGFRQASFSGAVLQKRKTGRPLERGDPGRATQAIAQVTGTGLKA